jgi:hypothetical protein
MSVFTDILKAIGLAPKLADAPKPAKQVGKTDIKPQDVSRYVKEKPMEMVDVAAKLDGMAKAKGLDPKNWRVSIVELLTLLGIDSSHANRVELAKELGISDELMGGDSAAMNIWLHKQVMKKLSEHGGRVPSELMD